ncbi:hypothetical protein AbraIFM66951_000078 [Aspergillus brasiliensis]|uniref:Uncharacterized protein n=1 Tax=Aspergillus brasiliensis TaxID=319629 RepID=A0A9W6DIM6_9EURO|nr:hypothetical protein AbraCBS73388_000268 [Aspergillus brasiliensis]GKZ40316.1 hypothetical protein AbraIFM66951_000078 [Aspergillus brasiliensis]
MASSQSAVNPEVTGPSLSDFPENVQNKIILIDIPAVEVQALIEKDCPSMLQRIAPYGATWMRHVMYNTIPKEIRVYAYLHYDMIKPDWYEQYGTTALLLRYNTHRSDLEQEVPEDQARSMLWFYALVQHYAHELTAIAIERQVNTSRFASRTELLRVQRAIYIHDILLQATTTIPRHNMTRQEARVPWRNFLAQFTGWMLSQVIIVTNRLHVFDHAKCDFSKAELQEALSTFSAKEGRKYLLEGGLAFKRKLDEKRYQATDAEDQLRFKCWRAAGDDIMAAIWAKLTNSDPEYNKQKFSPDTDPSLKRMYDPFVFLEEDNGPHLLWDYMAEEPELGVEQYYSGSGHPQYMDFIWDESRLRDMGYMED